MVIMKAYTVIFFHALVTSGVNGFIHDILTVRQATSALASRSTASSETGPLFGIVWKNPFENAFGGERLLLDQDAEARKELKSEILRRCALPGSKNKRAQVEKTINELAQFSPVKESATSPLLQKEWKVIWTTEKEINLFLEKGWATEILQTLDGSVLQNMIPFVKGGSLGVKGKIEADENNPIRTLFKFESAALDLAKWGNYNLPPVGQGWFDTVYLDDNLRVDLNSRNDILICTPYDSI
eukprot:CAMPEP_0198144740 /NCGR_PEP_ID=MMETSP1443-20131203/18270_1 /TAXON_ID=186043 /ORGANISM="Entomoneis sp., Strain CCMP2396" /LENGTH=240 /DNA_ID=CAMNT_0043808199 /DNA_START=25 /DNA_END=747 /DNA_ORIENTATION=+